MGLIHSLSSATYIYSSVLRLFPPSTSEYVYISPRSFAISTGLFQALYSSTSLYAWILLVVYRATRYLLPAIISMIKYAIHVLAPTFLALLLPPSTDRPSRPLDLAVLHKTYSPAKILS